MLMITEAVHSLQSSKRMLLAELVQTFPRKEMWNIPWLAATAESQGGEGKVQKRPTVYNTLFSEEFSQIIYPSLNEYQPSLPNISIDK